MSAKSELNKVIKEAKKNSKIANSELTKTLKSMNKSSSSAKPNISSAFKKIKNTEDKKKKTKSESGVSKTLKSMNKASSSSKPNIGTVFKGIKKSSKAAKKLSKKIKKASDKINKKITKSVRKHYSQKQKEKKIKEKERIRAQKKKDSIRKKELNKQRKLIDKVEANLKTATDRMMDAEMHEIPAYTYFNPYDSQNQLNKLKDKIDNGEVLSKKEYEYLKMASRKTYYDQMIKYEIDGEMVSQLAINRIRNKQVKKDLSEKEENILMKWANGTERANNINGAEKLKDIHFSPDSGQQPEESEDEYVERRKREVRRIKVEREVTVGGNSRLINDLWYTFECGDVGRRVFNLVQNAMRDPVAWNDIEAWYRRNYKASCALQARGNDWYESVVHGFLTMFIDFLNELSEKIKIDDDIIKEYETQLAEYID